MRTTNRKFLERKVEGPSVLRLWPGLYFDSDTGSGNGSGGILLKGEGMSAKLQVCCVATEWAKFRRPLHPDHLFGVHTPTFARFDCIWGQLFRNNKLWFGQAFAMRFMAVTTTLTWSANPLQRICHITHDT